MVLLRLIRMVRRLRANRAIGFGIVVALLAISLGGNAACYCIFDGASVGDALWYSVISITTIGYGDHAAESLGARIGTVVFISVLGLAAFSVFFGMALDWVSAALTRARRGYGKVMAKDHLLIVNFPSENRVLQLIDEIRADPDQTATEIVIISDRIEELPFTLDNVLFVRGSPHDRETYERARAKDAGLAIVLSLDYSDPNSDAVVAAAVSVLDAVEPDIHIVAECLDERHRYLFTAVRCDAVVPGLRIANNLLVQETHDPGVTAVISMLTSGRTGTTLHSTEVTSTSQSAYRDLAKSLLDRNVNVIAVSRGERSMTSFGDLEPEHDDTILYVADRRFEWPELLELVSD